MADVSIGAIYATNIPGYDASADIQAALRTYHYGSSTYTISNEDEEQLVNPSIAYHLKTIQDSVTALEELGVGGTYSATTPTSPVEGFIWVDSGSSPNLQPTLPNATYTSSEPTSPVDGQLWVVKGSSPLLMKIYESATSTWNTIGA